MSPSSVEDTPELQSEVRSRHRTFKYQDEDKTVTLDLQTDTTALSGIDMLKRQFKQGLVLKDVARLGRYEILRQSPMHAHVQLNQNIAAEGLGSQAHKLLMMTDWNKQQAMMGTTAHQPMFAKKPHFSFHVDNPQGRLTAASRFNMASKLGPRTVQSSLTCPASGHFDKRQDEPKIAKKLDINIGSMYVASTVRTGTGTQTGSVDQEPSSRPVIRLKSNTNAAAVDQMSNQKNNSQMRHDGVSFKPIMYVNSKEQQERYQHRKQPLKAKHFKGSMRSIDAQGAVSRNSHVGKSVDFAKMFKNCKTLERVNVEDLASTLRTSNDKLASDTEAAMSKLDSMQSVKGYQNPMPSAKVATPINPVKNSQQCQRDLQRRYRNVLTSSLQHRPKDGAAKLFRTAQGNEAEHKLGSLPLFETTNPLVDANDNDDLFSVRVDDQPAPAVMSTLNASRRIDTSMQLDPRSKQRGSVPAEMFSIQVKEVSPKRKRPQRLMSVEHACCIDNEEQEINKRLSNIQSITWKMRTCGAVSLPMGDKAKKPGEDYDSQPHKITHVDSSAFSQDHNPSKGMAVMPNLIKFSKPITSVKSRWSSNVGPASQIQSQPDIAPVKSQGSPSQSIKYEVPKSVKAIQDIEIHVGSKMIDDRGDSTQMVDKIASMVEKADRSRSPQERRKSVTETGVWRYQKRTKGPSSIITNVELSKLRLSKEQRDGKIVYDDLGTSLREHRRRSIEDTVRDGSPLAPLRSRARQSPRRQTKLRASLDPRLFADQISPPEPSSPGDKKHEVPTLAGKMHMLINYKNRMKTTQHAIRPKRRIPSSIAPTPVKTVEQTDRSKVVVDEEQPRTVAEEARAILRSMGRNVYSPTRSPEIMREYLKDADAVVEAAREARAIKEANLVRMAREAACDPSPMKAEKKRKFAQHERTFGTMERSIAALYEQKDRVTQYHKYLGKNALEQVLAKVPQKRLEFREQLSTAGKDTKLYLNKLMQEEVVTDGEKGPGDAEPEESDDRKALLSTRAHNSYKKAKDAAKWRAEYHASVEENNRDKNRFLTKYSLKTEQMLMHLKGVLQHFVQLQLKIDSRERKQGEAGTDIMDVFDFSNLDKEQPMVSPKSAETHVEGTGTLSGRSLEEAEKKARERQKRKKKRAAERAKRIEEARREAKGRLIAFGPATNKIRGIIADKILKRSLSDLERTAPLTVSTVMILNLRNFQQALRSVFPEGAAGSMGEKYIHMPGQFKNEFLHDLSQKGPQLFKYFRLVAEDDKESVEDAFPQQRVLRDEDALSGKEGMSDGGKSMNELNLAFQEKVDSLDFYDQAKVRSKFSKGKMEKIDVKRAGMRRYFEACHQHKTVNVINSNLISFSNNSQYLTNMLIPIAQAKALSDYLDDMRLLEEKQMRELIIDGCNMTDDIFSSILDGAVRQGRDDANCNGVRMRNQHLMALTYANNEIGQVSVEKLSELLPQMIDLRLNKVHFTQASLFENLLENVHAQGKILMTLRLSQFNLNDSRLLDLLVDVIGSRQYLQNVDVSYCNLKPKSLEQLIGALTSRQATLKSINLSYNWLKFDDDSVLPQNTTTMGDQTHRTGTDGSPRDTARAPTEAEGEQQTAQPDPTSDSSNDHQASVAVLEALKTLFKQAILVNHVNLSGMGLGKSPEHLLDLMKCMAACPLLMGIHLNDNGLWTTECSKLNELLDLFAISTDDIPVAKIRCLQSERPAAGPLSSMLGENKVLANLKRVEEMQEIDARDHLATGENLGACCPLFNVNVAQALSKYMRNDSPLKQGARQRTSPPPANSAQKSPLHIQIPQASEVDPEKLTLNEKRYHLKDHVTLGRQLKKIEVQRQKNATKLRLGVGRQETTSLTDFFVLTRVLNKPELVFNQRPQRDHDKNDRYFVRDALKPWSLQARDECYMCDRYRYTLIFFERGILARNAGLKEITDERIIRRLKYDFNKDYLQHRTYSPQIMGTVVKGKAGQGVYDRPLRMARASAFALLLLASGQAFSSKPDLIKEMQVGVLKFLKYDSVEVLKTMGIYQHLDGWSAVVRDFCESNELTDVLAVNKPAFSDYNLEARDFFCYAAYLQPGYHQFVIYDPRQERAFCQDVVVGLNHVSRDFYPELPLVHGIAMNKIVPNMWRLWQVDTPKDLATILAHESSQDEFTLSNYVTNPEDCARFKKILEDNFEHILVFQKLMQSEALKYPLIDFESAHGAFAKLQQEPAAPGLFVLPKAHLELAYIKACERGKYKGLKGSLMRREFLEFTCRVAVAFIRGNNEKQRGLLMSDHLQHFIDTHIKHACRHLKVHETRATIRGSKRLNELLFDNQKGLKEIFTDAKAVSDSPNHFTLKSALELFKQLNEPEGPFNVSDRQIKDCFIASMMTIQNEQKSQNKYHYLTFVEFLEMLCRYSLAAIWRKEEQDVIEFKVYRVMQWLYGNRYETGIWTTDSMPLKKVVQ